MKLPYTYLFVQWLYWSMYFRISEVIPEYVHFERQMNHGSTLLAHCYL